MKEIFKYVVPERIDVLKNLKIRFTQHSSLNDPFDLVLPTRTILTAEHFNKYFKREELFRNIPQNSFFEQLLKKEGKTIDDFYDEFLRQVRFLFTEENDLTKEYLKREFDKEFGVLSLTENPNSISMWGDYTGNHRGFIIKFNFDHPFFNHGFLDDKDCGIVKKVIYTNDLMILDSFMDLKVIGAQFLFRKGMDWKYQDEWRMLLPLKMADQIVEPDIHLFNIPPDMLTGIIFGEKCSDDLKLQVKNIRRTSPNLHHLDFYQAISSKHEYKMDYFPLNQF